MAAKKKETQVDNHVVIAPPNIQVAELKIVGDAPLVQNKFSAKARQKMVEQQMAGSTAKKGKKRDPKDFEQCFNDAVHRDSEGRAGISASALRTAAISACRLCGFQMTRAKLSIFIQPDGFDCDDGTPLVHLIADDPEMHLMHVRNETGVVDVRPRPMWREWSALPRVEFDADQFTVADIVNLFARVGRQVGIGEGRPDSKKSCGMGWGTFRIEG